MIGQRDFLLVPFPFPDQSGRKVRPVIVISNNNFNQSSEDVIVAGVTSFFSKGGYTISLGNSDFEEGKLITKCYIKTENLLKIEKSMIIKKIGKIKTSKLTEITALLNKLFSME